MTQASLFCKFDVNKKRHSENVVWFVPVIFQKKVEAYEALFTVFCVSAEKNVYFILMDIYNWEGRWDELILAFFCK